MAVGLWHCFHGVSWGPFAVVSASNGDRFMKLIIITDAPSKGYMEDALSSSVPPTTPFMA